MQIDAPLLSTAELNSILSKQIQEREDAILAERVEIVKAYQKKKDAHLHAKAELWPSRAPYPLSQWRYDAEAKIFADYERDTARRLWGMCEKLAVNRSVTAFLNGWEDKVWPKNGEAALPWPIAIGGTGASAWFLCKIRDYREEHRTTTQLADDLPAACKELQARIADELGAEYEKRLKWEPPQPPAEKKPRGPRISYNDPLSALRDAAKSSFKYVDVPTQPTEQPAAVESV
jgi:hypothetical protein